MRSFGVALIIAFVAAFLAPAAASAAKPAESPITKEQRQKGMDAAPALITAAGLDCKLADARLIGQSTDPKTKVTSSFYELACDGNEGMIIQSTVGAAPGVFTCVEASAPGPDGKKSNVACILPGNVDPNAGLKPYIAKAGTACDLDKVRAIGHNTSITAFELACKGGQGFILQISTPPRLDKPVTMVPCLALPPDGNIQCTLSDRASQLAMVDRLVTQSGKPCAIKDRRYIGTSPTTGAVYYEVACQDGKGYVIQTAADGAYKAMIDCAAAEGIGGGCTLTNYRESESQQAGLYSQLARKAGYNCDVSKYAPLPADVPGKEVVELVCSNRPDGAIAEFAIAAGGVSTIFDCAHSELVGFRCAFSQPSTGYPNLTAELKKLGKTTCAVSNSRVLGVTADKRNGDIEVACADGLPGFVIEFSLSPLAATSVLPCSQAGSINGGCTLAGNKRS